MNVLWIKESVMKTNVYECTGCLPVISYKNYLLFYKKKRWKERENVLDLHLKG